MKKILFLPLLQMKSGHHLVAETLMDMIRKYMEDIQLKKIDLLSYTNEFLEKVISGSYMQWILRAPRTYSRVYETFFYGRRGREESVLKWHEPYFIKKLEQLLREEKPDLVVCTHGYPSRLMSKIKSEGKSTVPVMNVYTDFFVNTVWGIEGIDLHLLPGKETKDMLSHSYRVSDEKLVVTGIPVHGQFTKGSRYHKTGRMPRILIAGGNCGLGGILKLVNELETSKSCQFFVLCGNNEKLYNQLEMRNMDNIVPLPYIASRKEMNILYEKVDAIITKPGGVTISEALKKKLPIFIYSALPGQEMINLQYLQAKHLVFFFDRSMPIEKQLLGCLRDDLKIKRWEQAVSSYQDEIEVDSSKQLARLFKQFIDRKNVGVEIFS